MTREGLPQKICITITKQKGWRLAFIKQKSCVLYFISLSVFPNNREEGQAQSGGRKVVNSGNWDVQLYYLHHYLDSKWITSIINLNATYLIVLLPKTNCSIKTREVHEVSMVAANNSEINVCHFASTRDKQKKKVRIVQVHMDF